MRLLSLIVLVGLAGCDAKGGGGNGSGAPKVAESGTKRGSASGFSAQMSAELAKQNVEPATIASAPAPAKPATTATPGTPGTSTPGTSTPGTSTPGASTPGTSTPAMTSAGTSTTAATGSGSGPAAAGSKAGSTQIAVAPTGKDVKLATPPPDQATAPSTAPPPAGGAKKAGTAIDNRVAAKPSAEIAAIKMDLEPNWERDIGEAGTFSLVVKVPPTNEERVFYARYGYEDQASPVDCDAYRKFLEDKKIMTVTLNRQRGAACYIEGSEPSGGIVYRYLLVYGGKHLMCSGSLYKDQAALGDLRDKVLMQAKKICETLTL